MKAVIKKRGKQNRRSSKDGLYKPYSKKSQKAKLSKISKKKISKNTRVKLKIKSKSCSATKRNRIKIANIANILDQEAILCSICFEIFLFPTTLLCGHTFCHSCLKQLEKNGQNESEDKRRYKEACPLCRKSFSSQILQINQNIYSYISLRYDTIFSKDERIKYDNRKRNIEEQIKKENYRINIDNLSLKIKLKMKIGNHKETGEVISILQGENIKMIEVRSLKDLSVYRFKSSTLNLYSLNPQNVIVIEDENQVGINIQLSEAVNEISYNQNQQFSEEVNEISENEYMASMHNTQYFRD